MENRTGSYFARQLFSLTDHPIQERKAAFPDSRGFHFIGKGPLENEEPAWLALVTKIGDILESARFSSRTDHVYEVCR